MLNVSVGLLDGGAVPHHVTGDAGDRAGSLDDDEHRAGGAARSALALLAPPCGVGYSRLGGSGMVCRVIGWLRWMHEAAPATVSCPASHVACSVSLRTARCECQDNRRTARAALFDCHAYFK
eukprot:2815148-Prymnesium_polylepis.1